MSETIDTLIYALDGDLTKLKATFAAADAEAQKSGQKIGTAFSKPLQQAADQAAKSAKVLQTALAGGGTAAQQQAKELDALRLKYDAHYAATQKAATIQADLNKLVGGGVMTAGQAAKAFAKLTEEVGHGHGSAAVATREFRALFDELTSGRTRMTPGTLAIIATRVFGISGATLAWSAALVGVAGALVVAGFQAEAMFARVQRGLLATGYAAGATKDQIVSMAQALDRTSHMSEKSAIVALTALTARGNVDTSLLPGGARAVAGYAAATGVGVDKAGPEFEKLLSDPAKASAELYDQFKLLTVAQQEEIKTLAASGDKEKAQALIIDAVNDRFGKLEDSSWSLAKAWDFVSKGISDWWLHTGEKLSHAAGPTQRLQDVTSREAAIDTQLRQYGVAGIGAARAMIQRDPHMAEFGVGDKALGNLVAEYGGLEAQKAPLQHQIDIQNAAAKGGELFRRQQDAVGYGLKLSQQYDEQGRKVKELTEQQGALNKALGLAIGPDVQFQDGIRKTKAAVDAALAAVKEYGDPAHEAALRAREQARINAATPENRARISAEVEAARGLRERLQNPATALEARSIYQTEMQTADMPDRYNRQADQRATALKAIQEEATGAEQLAHAYDDSTAAAEHAKIETEAQTKAIELHITNLKEAAKFEAAYAAALEKRAFWQQVAASAQALETMNRSNLGLQNQLAAGGNPWAIAQAKREQDAFTPSIVAELTGADTMEKHMRAYADYQKQLGALTQRDQLSGLLANSQYQFQQNRSLGNLQQTAGAVFGGASDDDLRHLKVAQETMDTLSKQLDPMSDGFKDVYQQALQVNEAMSDLTDSLEKAQREASGLAGDITGGLGGYLKNPNQRPIDVATGIGRNMLSTIVQSNILEPMNKWLTSEFSGLIGGAAPGKPGETYSNPMWVQVVGTGSTPGIFNAPLGGGAGGGGLDAEGNPIGSYTGTPPFFPGQQGGSGVYGPGGLAGPGSLMAPGGMNNLFSSMSNGTGMFGANGIFGSSGFFSNLFNGGGGAGSASDAILSLFGQGSAGMASTFASADTALSAMPDIAGLGDAADAAISTDALSSFADLLPLVALAGGGDMDPGTPYIVGDQGPEILSLPQGGRITPLSAPVVQAAMGSQVNAGGGNDNSVGPIHINLPGVTDAQSFIRSSSQVSAAITKAASLGKRNT